MNPIRPNVLPPTTPANASQDAAKLAAARAFFATALGQGNVTQAAATPEPAAAVVPTKSVAPAAPGDTPQKFLRPGSLIDIRV